MKNERLLLLIWLFFLGSSMLGCGVPPESEEATPVTNADLEALVRFPSITFNDASSATAQVVIPFNSTIQ